MPTIEEMVGAVEKAKEDLDGHGIWSLAKLERLDDVADALRGMAWRPIAEAPRDGTTILVYGQPSDLVIDENTLVSFKAPRVYTAAWDEIDGAFCLSGGSWLGPFVGPTHFMPLPPPPAGAGG